jgi:hypothetical protein
MRLLRRRSTQAVSHRTSSQQYRCKLLIPHKQHLVGRPRMRGNSYECDEIMTHGYLHHGHFHTPAWLL